MHLFLIEKFSIWRKALIIVGKWEHFKIDWKVDNANYDQLAWSLIDDLQSCKIK
jgi:hypothetical protein